MLLEEVGSAKETVKAREAELAKNQRELFGQMDKWEQSSKKGEKASIAVSDSAGANDELAELREQNKSLERQLVNMTGKSIMSMDAADLEKENKQLKALLAEEKATSQAAKLELLDSKEHEETTLERLRDVADKETLRRREVEDSLRNLELSFKAQEEQATEQIETARLKLTATLLELEAARKASGELETKVLRQHESFEAAEQQRLAALDGKTAALLQAEREKVMREEKIKRDEEINQIIADQRAAMEAIVHAVRMEERMNMKVENKRAQAAASAVPGDGAANGDSSAGTFKTSEKSPGMFASFFSGTKAADKNGAVPPSSGSLPAPVPEPVAVPAADPQGAGTAANKYFGAQVSAETPKPRVMNLAADLTTNTADIAKASLNYMSL